MPKFLRVPLPITDFEREGPSLVQAAISKFNRIELKRVLVLHNGMKLNQPRNADVVFCPFGFYFSLDGKPTFFHQVECVLAAHYYEQHNVLSIVFVESGNGAIFSYMIHGYVCLRETFEAIQLVIESMKLGNLVDERDFVKVSVDSDVPGDVTYSTSVEPRVSVGALTESSTMLFVDFPLSNQVPIFKGMPDEAMDKESMPFKFFIDKISTLCKRKVQEHFWSAGESSSSNISGSNSISVITPVSSPIANSSTSVGGMATSPKNSESCIVLDFPRAISRASFSASNLEDTLALVDKLAVSRRPGAKSSHIKSSFSSSFRSSCAESIASDDTNCAVGEDDRKLEDATSDSQFIIAFNTSTDSLNSSTSSSNELSNSSSSLVAAAATESTSVNPPSPATSVLQSPILQFNIPPPPPPPIKNTFTPADLIRKVENNSSVIVAGTKEALINSLVEGSTVDSEYIDCFLLTFRQWMTPKFLIESLQRQYAVNNLTDESKSSSLSSPIALKYINVLKKMVERHFFDFEEPENLAALTSFFKILRKDRVAQNLIDHCQRTLEFRIRMSKTENCIIDVMYKDPTIPEAFDLLSQFDLSQLNATSLGQQLSLIDIELFKAVQPDAISRFLWGEKDKSSPHLVSLNRYIEHFNRIGFFTATCVVFFKEVKMRAYVLGKFIKAAKVCYDNQDFNTCMAILSGLGTTAVSRLKSTWDMVPSRRMTMYNNVEASMSFRNNFRAYRNSLASAKGPVIPFFGLIVKDWTFMNDGNCKYREDGLVNFEKSRTIAASILNMQRQQDSSFSFQPIAHYMNFLRNAPALSKRDLLSLSKSLEP